MLKRIIFKKAFAFNYLSFHYIDLLTPRDKLGWD